MLPVLSTLLFILAPARQEPARALGPPPEDPRSAYDVRAYLLDLRVDPRQQTIEGTAGIEAVVCAEELREVVLDAQAVIAVKRATLEGAPTLEPAPGAPGAERASAAGGRSVLEVERAGAVLRLRLPRSLARGEPFVVLVDYEASPRAENDFDGFHWKTTGRGAPWICTSSQSLGSSSWWPGKDSFYHPEDKPERLFVDLTVPSGLVGVSNGRLWKRERRGEEWETFRWRHDYPLPTYAVTLDVAPYEVIAGELVLDGISGKVPYAYYVLPEDLDKAKVQFAQVPGLIEAYGRAFGPFPFPRSKIGLVQTCFWGMEHSTAVAYGSSFPAWLARTNEEDPYRGRNRYFDYILVHEMAHEWWGNAVSAADWGDFWLHEGFATYAEGVYLELTAGREVADKYFREMQRQVPRYGRLYRGKGADSGQAYASILYAKGALVLNTLRHYLDDDERWWAVLRGFNLAYRYRSATTEDFRAFLERETGRDWQAFFAEWVHGEGLPALSGSVRAGKDRVAVEVENPPCKGTGFHVPLDLAWFEDGERRTRRVLLEPGSNRLEIPCAARPLALEVMNLQRVLGKHRVAVE